MRGKKALITAGYIAFGVIALFLGIYLTFPADAVGQRLTHEVQKSTQGKLMLSFEDVSLYRLSGIEAEGVRVKIAQDGSSPLEFQLDELRARLRLLPLLWLSLSVDAEVEVGDGVLAARLTPGTEGGFSTDLELEELSLTSPPVLPGLVGVPLGGKISGEVHGDWSEKDSKATTGAANLKLEGMSFGPGTLRLPMPGMSEKMDFTLPTAIELGTLTLDAPIEQGKLTIKSFNQTGGDLAIKLSGNLSLRPQLSASGIDVCLMVKPEQAFLTKNPKIRDALALAEVQLKKDGQGFLNVPLAGTIGRPRLKGGLCRVGSGGGGTATP